MKPSVIAIILGGGAGTRLYPLTEQRSKPAVPVAGKYRLIDIPISNCLNSGVKRMFVLTQFNSASLNQHIKNTYHFDIFSNGFVDILAAEQTRDSNKWFQGTADAVRQCAPHMDIHDFDYVLVLSGDQLYQMDFQKFLQYHIQQKADLTIATIPVDKRDAPAFGIMKVNESGSIDSFIEKPDASLLPEWESEVSPKNKEAGKVYLASMGIYVFTRGVIGKLFDTYPKATDFGKELIPATINNNYKVASYQYDGYWTDIGNISSFFDANLSLTDNIPQFNLFDSLNPVHTRPRMLPPTKTSGTYYWRSIVSEGSIIQADKIEQSVIGIRSRIGDRTVIHRSIIMGNDFYEQLEELKDTIPMGIGNNCHIENAIIDKNCRVGDNVIIKGGKELPDEETDTHVVKNGVIVLKKGAEIANGRRIGVS